MGWVWFWGFWGDFCFVFGVFFHFTDNSPETKNRKRLIITHEFLLQSHFIGPKTVLSRSTFWFLCPDSLRHFANSSSLFPAPPRDLQVHFQGQHTSTERYRNLDYCRLFTDLPAPCTNRSHARDRSQCELCEM